MAYFIEFHYIIIIEKKNKTPIEISGAFHNGSNCDYYSIIKKLVEEFKGQFEFQRGNTKKCITSLVPIQKQNKNDKTVT